VIRAYGVLAGVLDDAVKSRRLAANRAGARRICPARQVSGACISRSRMSLD
jgi:hypothetical protein